jgi:2-polyprenyl-3-methyl-5-hydroxy-6-metoxy-1,4-benzoquinol methylase
VHDYFHWDPRSVRVRGRYTLAHFSNEHAGCYALTRAQLAQAVASGGFLVDPHEWKYGMLETAATDPYTQCGFQKLIPISHLEAFTVQHLPNKYVGKLGVSGPELAGQVDALMRLAGSTALPAPLLETATRLRKGLYSKSYYEPIDRELVAAIPSGVRSVLSVGCGAGATERWLAEKGVRVVAVPLDAIIGSGTQGKGVEMLVADLQLALEKLRGERFDCVLCSNILHLADDPMKVLTLFREVLKPESAVVLRLPNMLSLATLRLCLTDPETAGMLRRYDKAGTHFVSLGGIHAWCRRAGLEVCNVAKLLPRYARGYEGFIPSFARSFLASDFIAVARKAS